MLQRIRRHKRIRKKIFGTGTMPRLSVYRSNKNMQVQLVDDEKCVTMLGMSTKSLRDVNGTKTEKAKHLGYKFGKKVIDKVGIKKIVFDRGGYKYHGRVKAVAEGLRESGLQF